MSRMGNKVSRLSAGTINRQTHRLESAVLTQPTPIERTPELINPVNLLSYRELQAKAKELGIKASGTAKDLINRIEARITAHTV